MSRAAFASASTSASIHVLARRVIVASFAIVAVSNACTCEEPDPPGNGRPSLVAQFPDGTNLQSDGSSTLTVVLQARDAERAPDLSPIELTASENGFFAPDGAANITVTPNDQGTAEIELQCEPNADGRLDVAADNGSAQANFSINCNEPEGQIVLDIEPDPADADCDGLQADGQSACTFIVTVSQNAGGVIIPLEGPVTVRVAEATVLDAADTADLDIVTTVGGNAGAQEVVVTAALDGDESTASFDVIAPAVAEDVVLEVTFEDFTQNFGFQIEDFVNQADILFGGNSESNVVGGDTATVDIIVTNASGNPAAGDTVEVSIIAESATLAAGSEGTVPLDAAGAATLTVNTSAVTATEQATVHVEYTFLDTLAPLSEDFVISINEAGAVILNVAADPGVVQSDDPQNDTSTVTVTFTQNASAISGGTVTLTINDPTRLAFSDGSSTRVISAFDADGVADIDVIATPDVAPGLVRIDAVGEAPGEPDVNDDVQIEVERAPVLASMTPGVPTPPQIGVRGSALPTTTVITFALRDDRDNPMPNVAVTFELPETADPGISVTLTDVSDAGGIVKTVLAAGTIAGPVTVTANAGNLSVQSTPIVILGGLPNHQSSFMGCGDAIPNVEGTSFDCTAVLADRFTNLAGNQGVQFRSEGSATDAFAISGDDGVAGATMVLDDGDTVSAASVPAWSFGFIPRNSPTVDASFDPACFDATTNTPCDLIEICNDQANTCPLPLSCVDRAQNALALMDGGTTVRDLAEIIDYIADFRACGFPVACLRGDTADFEGILDLGGDECNLAAGCFDYSAATECPHDGILTVTASTRGEEAFVDGNGNGRFDFVDQNGDAIHQANEPILQRPELCILGSCESDGSTCNDNGDCGGTIDVDAPVDLPEPFTDKNDNCARDDLTNSPRLPAPSDRVQHTDLFNDVDGNEVFGFDVGGEIQERNGVFDSNTEIFLSAHVLVFGTEGLDRGRLCATPGIGGCREIRPGLNVDPGLIPGTLNPGESTTITYRFADFNGNCVSPGFGAGISVSATGPVVISGDTDISLNQQRCGFGSRPNNFFPQCEDLPSLGAPVGTVTIAADCAENAEADFAEISFIGSEVVDKVTIFIACPATP